MATERPLDDYPLRSHDKLRYGDTDRQGHVNNAAFATFFETGRVELVYQALTNALEAGQSFVIARLELDFLGEINWPGTVEIGTGVVKVGRSSITVEQSLFQNGRRVAGAVSVVVLTDTSTRRSTPLSPAALANLDAFRLNDLPSGG